MNKRYQAMRAVLNKSLHVICCEGKFETLPDEVRHRGPWQVLSRGEIETLRAEYRHALALNGSSSSSSRSGSFRPQAVNVASRTIPILSKKLGQFRISQARGQAIRITRARCGTVLCHLDGDAAERRRDAGFVDLKNV